MLLNGVEVLSVATSLYCFVLSKATTKMAILTRDRDPIPSFLSSLVSKGQSISLLAPLRRWLNGIDVNHPDLARVLCYLIPCQCPFERTIRFLGKTYRIPALCKFNPLYYELVGLRFRALSYLADTCNSVNSQQLPITSYQLPTTNNQQQITNNK
jgi:hypothetical protein